MKKLLLTLFFAVGCLSIYAQGLFFRVGGGYNTGILKSVIGQNINSNTSSNDETTTRKENVYASYGQGVYLGARIGYMFTNHIGADLGLNYILGNNYQFNEKTTSFSSFKEAVSNTSANTWLINPCLILSTSQEKTLSLYTRVGIAFGLPSATLTSKSTEGSFSLGTTEAEFRVNMAPGIGFTGAVGLDVHFGKLLGVYGEINLLAMATKTKSAEYTKYTVNGEDQLQNLPQKKFDYVDSQAPTDSPQNQFNSGENSFSAIGINIGLKIRL